MEEITKSAQSKCLPYLQVDVFGMENRDIEEESIRHLCKLIIDWVELFCIEEDDLDSILNELQALYLTDENTLRRCSDMEENEMHSKNDVIRDYKKAAKMNRKVSRSAERLFLHSATTDLAEDFDNKSVKVDSMSPEHRSAATRSPVPNLRKTPSVQSFEMIDKEWKVIACNMIGDKQCQCFAMLENRLCLLSVNLRFLDNQVDLEVVKPGPVSGNTSPAGSQSPKHVSNVQRFLVPLATMSSPRCGVGSAVLDGKLIAMGGYDRGECLGTVEAYDTANNAWLPMPQMLSPRGRFDVSQLYGKLFACGGSDGQKELRTVECYDPDKQKWTSLPSMSAPRSSAGVAVLNGKLYVVGGWGGQCGLAKCEVYDPDLGKWSPIARLNTGRSQAAVCVLNNKLVAAGGGDAWQCLSTVEMYDPAENKWTYLPSMATARRGHGIALFKGKLYVVGGSDGSSSLQTIEIYDPATESWSFGPLLSVPRANVSVAVVKNWLFAVGGFAKQVFLDTIEYLSEDGQEWCVCAPPDPESPNLLKGKDQHKQDFFKGKKALKNGNDHALNGAGKRVSTIPRNNGEVVNGESCKINGSL